MTFTPGTDSGSSSVTKDGVTISMSTMSRSDNYRCYDGTKVSISSSVGNITKIQFTFSSNSNKGGFSASYTPNAASWTSAKASGQARFTKIVVTYTASCTKIGAPTVTATPGDGRIDLSWSNQTGASSYSVTKTPAGGTVGTPSKSGSTWSCAITGLTNGTTYTWSVEAVGSGDYCASGNTAASASATPNVFRTITYYDKDGQHTTSLADGTNIATALTALYGGDDPVSCDATNYEYFVGWKVGEISGTASSVTLLDDEVVNASSPSNNYYAVWSDTDPSAGGWTKVTSISVGDVVVFAYDADYKEMTSVTTTGTTYGSATAVDPYPDDLSGDYALTVEAGNGGTGYSFKHGSVYLSWSSGNSLTTSGTKADASSWTISESSSGNFKFANVGTTSRILQYNSGSPRWACYGNSNQSAFQIYRQSGGGDAEYITTCCTDPELAYGTGSVTKTFGDVAFTNTLTNSHSVAVTYSSSDPTVATVNGSGQVTILKAGSTTITASSAAQTVSTVDYCADEASYTLTVNKADISPTLTYTPNSVAAGSNTSAPTVGGNPGSGGVTYAITSATPPSCATINTSTGVVTGVAVGSVTVTATVAATDNYNGGSATANVTITAASGYCISAFNSSNNGITSGFSNGGSGNEYTLNYTIPGKDGSSNWPQYWIGENEAWASFSANALFADMHFTHSDATLGLAEGATGKLHIWDDNKASGSNLWVKFEPDGYGFRWGGAGEWDQAANTKAFTVDPGNANTYWTEIVTLDGTNNTSWSYYVGLQSASGYVYSGVDDEEHDGRGLSRTTSVTAMKVSNGTSGSFKATYLNSEATGTRGKFRIWDNNITSYNFVCHFVPFYRVTYDGSGADGSTAASADVCCEGNQAARTVQAAANEFTVPTGKSFGGWASSPENAAAGVVAYAAGANVVLTSSITLYAIWTDIDYTVTVNQSPAAGATTTGQTSSAHYNGTINLTVTDIPSGYRFVNWTSSDVTITNPTSATTASFTMPAKNVTVTANFQQTHTVDWYVGGSAPANKIGDDGQTTVVDHGGKIEDFPATTPDGTPCDKTFVGWTNTSSYVHGTSPLFNDVAGSPVINTDASFYAVFATGGGDDFELVTAVSQLHVGDVVTIANFVGNSESGAVIKAYNSGNNWPKASASTDASGKISESTTDMQTFTLEEGSVDDTWAFNDGTGYPYAASSSSNYMKREAAKSANSSFSITIDGSTSVATIVAQGDYTRNVMQYNSSSNLFACYGSASQASVYLYKKPSYTGHTITCSDCGTSVTPTYTASPTGGTVSVTKSASPVTSGSTVKTCTAVDLTVTITPASHYTLTGFTATGLSTGTATISPAVNTVVPTTSEQTFTVTVSAGATGTLNLTPTFTPETPLTITLNTNGKGTFTNPDPWPIYSGESFTFPDVTPNDPSCATFVGWIEGTTFVGDGTTHDAPVTIAAGSSSGAQSSNTTYTAVFYETETSESDAYVKVTAAPEPPATWANDHYLIVYEDAGNSYTNAVAFAGSRDNGDNGNIDATSNGIAVTIVGGNTIAATSSLAANEWRIAAVTGGYSIQSASGYYIGRAANSNGIDASNSTAYVNTIGYSDSRTNITSAGSKILKYNTAGDQLRFRYLTSAGDIQLYKLGTAVVETRTYTTNPSCTPKYRVTVASVTGGSPSADPKFNPESTTVTITANPSAGYSFTSWTITKTTGGDNVTSTLLTGDKPTTANTTFTMPAYDITIAATYAKKMVTELKVMDDETVVANTTGPVSGILNVSTGANKTLDVVITPSDAFDHSWTATVSAGSTYASITNVTAEGFRVNGEAQGDATITVTASNDEANGGTPKVVTFTVHVTDMLLAV